MDSMMTGLLISGICSTGCAAAKPGAMSRFTSRFCASLNGDSYSHRRPRFNVNEADARQSSRSGKSSDKRPGWAIGRALLHRPRVVFADEPTGNLDSTTGTQVIDLLLNLHRDHGTTLVLVTHDAALASLMQRVVSLRDGRLEADSMSDVSDLSIDDELRP